MTRSENKHPLRNSIFQWSFFGPELACLSSESAFKTPEEAEAYHKKKEGEIAFDNGQEIRSMLFGLYLLTRISEPSILIVEEWDKDRDDLVGAAGILNFEWENWADPSDIPNDLPEDTDDDVDIFKKDWVFARLSSDVEEINEWWIRWRQRQRAKAKLEEKTDETSNTQIVELFDLYHAWRTLSSLKTELSSGADVYDIVDEVRDSISDLADAVLERLPDWFSAENCGDAAPEEVIMNYIKANA